MRARPPALLTALAAASIAIQLLVACGGDQSSGTAVPTTPQALSARLSAVDSALRRAVHGWRRDGQPARGAPPDAVIVQALYVQRAMRLLSRRPHLAEATIRRLPSRLAGETRDLTGALRDLHRLSAGWPAHRVRTGPPKPLGKLLGYYLAAQRRFGVGWHVLAAVNLVESAFGRARNASVAGAQGPMQFVPATWRIYGLGGDIRDPRDAILGAANFLHHSGAPGSYTRALYAYNPSRLYVDAVRRFARQIARDRDAVYFLYAWQVGVVLRGLNEH
jgi:soluble lytic murein transglycosylase-like protein